MVAPETRPELDDVPAPATLPGWDAERQALVLNEACDVSRLGLRPSSSETPDPTSVLSVLESFNRKERFFVVCAALDLAALQLGPTFRRRVEMAFGIGVTDPVFVAIDYHQDWLMAALRLAHGEITENQPYSDPAGRITGNQEDVDLLIAFSGAGTTHLVMLEAKAETGYGSRQMDSKAAHLAGIFGHHGDHFRLVTPHFGLLSPRPPVRLGYKGRPTWMAPNGTPVWLELDVPKNRRRVVRCNAVGQRQKSGGHFIITSG